MNLKQTDLARTHGRRRFYLRFKGSVAKFEVNVNKHDSTDSYLRCSSGSVLGPFLFIWCMLPFGQVIRPSIHSYADDPTLYKCVPSGRDAGVDGPKHSPTDRFQNWGPVGWYSHQLQSSLITAITLSSQDITLHPWCLVWSSHLIPML